MLPYFPVKDRSSPNIDARFKYPEEDARMRYIISRQPLHSVLINENYIGV